MTSMSMKLFIDRNSNKVLYAEAGKDFVDFLLHRFMMPLGFAMKHVFHGAVVGGLSNLYTSVAEDLSVDYLQAGSTTKACFLNPNFVKTFNSCSYGCSPFVVSDVQGAKCPRCQLSLSKKIAYVAPPEYKIDMGEGYVKGQVTYMITDDLVVNPLSTSLSMMLLSQLRIKDLGCIQETEVTLDYNQGMKLVKASLSSKTVLTDTFLAMKNAK